MDYPTTETFAPLPTEELSAEDKITELRQKVDELHAELANTKRVLESQTRTSTEAHNKINAYEAMLAPLVSYIGEALIESGGFQLALGELVSDQVRDSYGGREFCEAVSDAVDNLSFEVTVRSELSS